MWMGACSPDGYPGPAGLPVESGRVTKRNVNLMYMLLGYVGIVLLACLLVLFVDRQVDRHLQPL